jgi:AcrR family transcriptional regulator
MTTPDPEGPLTPERRRRQTREHLLAAAARVFAARGFNGASLEEVAAAAGFTKGAVYSNFASKEDLLLALAESHLDEVLGRVHALLARPGTPPDQRLEDFAGLVDENLAAERDVAILTLEFWLYALRHPEVLRRVTAIERAQTEAIAAIISADRARTGETGPEPADVAARLVVALFHGMGIVQLLDPDGVDAGFAAAAVRLAARGITG